MIAFAQKQLAATFARHNAGGDTVLLTLGPGIIVNALREFDYEQADPGLGGIDSNKKMQLRFPASALGANQFHVDFEIGDRCYIGGPTALNPSGTFDNAKWELKYYRVSADGLLISVGLGAND